MGQHALTHDPSTHPKSDPFDPLPALDRGTFTVGRRCFRLVILIVVVHLISALYDSLHPCVCVYFVFTESSRDEHCTVRQLT